MWVGVGVGLHLLLHHQDHGRPPARPMDKSCYKFVALGTLLLFATVSILLLTVHVDEIKETPEYMVSVIHSNPFMHENIN